MIGIFLASFGTFFDEVSLTIGKSKVGQNLLSIYTMGFLNYFFGTLILVLVIIFKQKFIFSFASLPTFCTRAVLEVILAQVSILAICRADRSLYGFIRVLTVPILLVVDLILGYYLSNWQIAGMILIIFTLFFVFSGKELNKKGAIYCLATALLAVATLSLYKYDISHFNSVEAEQTLIQTIILLYLLLMAIFKAKENPFTFFKKPIFITQSFSAGLSNAMLSYAYSFAPASIIISAIRSTSVFWTVVSGRFYFKEKYILIKIVYLSLLIVGLILLVK